MFFGRDNEKKKILNILAENSMQTCLIYGRRRVGKSELINHCLQETNKKKIYFECKQTTSTNNALSICELIEEQFGIPYQNDDIEKVLTYLFKIAYKEEFILVLDEYPYLREVVKGIDSIIQKLVDENRSESKIKLILCGSYIDIMKSLVEHDNPLYGRFDYILELKPMNYYESQLFYDDYSLEDKVKIYSVFGGIPYYNRLINTKKTVEENIIHLIASDGARLENEISSFLYGQMTKINNANQVFETLAKGYKKFKDILDNSHVSSGPTLVDVLDKLIDMGVVMKISPINDSNNRKKISYYISDNLSDFYYKYIYPNKSKLKLLESNVFFNKFIKQDFETKYVPHKFEEIVKQYLVKENIKGNINPPFFELGKYYYDDAKNKTNGEFDIVTLDELGYIFYEVKFINHKLKLSDILKEIEQVKQTGLECYKYGFIAKNGFSFENSEYILLNIDDIYKKEK